MLDDFGLTAPVPLASISETTMRHRFVHYPRILPDYRHESTLIPWHLCLWHGRSCFRTHLPGFWEKLCDLLSTLDSGTLKEW